jgi:hypothetical protein
MSAPKGYSSQEKEERLSAQFQTIEPVRSLQFGSSVVAHQFVYEVATDAAEAGSTAYSIVASSHSALKGDVILLTSGALSGREVKVWSVSTNLITLAETLPSAVAAAVTFKILRHKYPSVDSTGAVNVNAVIAEEALAADGGALPAQLKVMGGYDGSAVQVIKTDAAGELQVDVLSSALPSGAATSAVQTDGTQKTQIVDGSGNVIGSTGNALDVNLKTPITVDVSLSQANDSVAVFGSDGATNRALKTDAAGELQIDVLSSALPSGAATAAKQPALGTAGTASADVITVQGIASMTALKVDGSAVTQPISAASLPLPAGAATSAAQTDGTQKTKIVDAAGGVVTTTTSGPVKALDVHIAVDATSPGNDVFATQMVGTRYNQIEVNFETAPGATFITQTFSGGGAVSHTNGHALYSTGTAVSAQAKAVSVGTVVYRPANEIYAYFTAAFTAPTSAASHQRIGIYDSTDGFFIGYEGTSFGVTTRSGGSDSSVARASFNGDLLTGAAGSKFTRNGSPEAINLAYSNLFRIRFGWLGSGSILFDVFSPDGVWVNFHTIKQPNSSINPSIQKPDLPITLDVQKSSSDATNLIMATACWAGGTSSQFTRITDTLTNNSLAGLTRAVITGVTTGGGGGYVNVKVNPSGALVVDVTGAVEATQSGTWNINNVSGTISLPTGAATEATLADIKTAVELIDNAVSGSELQVDIVAALPSGTNTIGKVDVNTLSVVDLLDAGILDTSSTNIAGSASNPTQVVASTAAATKKLQLLDTTGAFIGVYTGAALSEVLQFVMGPGSDQTIEHSIPAGTRISLKRLDSTTAISSGIVAINFIG